MRLDASVHGVGLRIVTQLYISLLVHYLCAQKADFPHLALVIVHGGVEFNRSARGGATVVGQGYSQTALWQEDSVVRE